MFLLALIASRWRVFSANTAKQFFVEFKRRVIFNAAREMSEIKKLSPIRPGKFYEDDSRVRKKIAEIEEKVRRRPQLDYDADSMQQSLFGPTMFWRKYFKQADALASAVQHSTENNPLSTFVYQDAYNNGRRIFMVAHPEVYWHFFSQQPPAERCAYEVIPEGAPCWLYLDLEFLIPLNPNSNGVIMTKTIMEIFSAYLKKYWKIECTNENILNLDSTTSEKFSRHLIFCIKDVAFKHNIHAGRFVKSIVNDIQEHLSSNGSLFHDVLSYFSLQQLEELFVETDKKKKIFVDTMVYSKNRHFRVYKATKWGKFAHLELAPDCNYITNENKKKDLGIFLDSLVSYFPNKSAFTLLEFNEDMTVNVRNYPKNCGQNHRFLTQQPGHSPSPFPELDKFILKIVEPGYIRTTIYFKQSRRIIYDILGNRYCANIKRAHKSNNIYYVVDLDNKCYYQKCHDEEDCHDFKSDPQPIPIEIMFLIEEEDDQLFLDVPDTSDENLSQFIVDTSL